MSRDSPRIDDRLLLKRAVNDKDRNAFEVLYAKYYGRLERYIAQRIDSVINAEDLAQDVFVRLWETSARYEIRKPVEAYLFAVAHNVIAQYLRKRKKHPQSVPMDSIAKVAADHSIQQDQESADQVLQHQLQKIIRDIAVRLSPKAYEAIRLRFIEGLSVQEAARKAGCSVKAFYSRQERSLKALEQMIAEKENG